MYTLRTVYKDKTVSNINLGASYTVCYPASPAFNKKTASMDGDRISDIRLFVFSESGTCFVIDGENQYFIMTETGKTFERL